MLKEYIKKLQINKDGIMKKNFKELKKLRKEKNGRINEGTSRVK